MQQMTKTHPSGRSSYTHGVGSHNRYSKGADAQTVVSRLVSEQGNAARLFPRTYSSSQSFGNSLVSFGRISRSGPRTLMSGRTCLHNVIRAGISVHAPASSFKAPSSLSMKHMGLRYARTLDDSLLSDEFWIRTYGGDGEDADPHSRPQGGVDKGPCKEIFQNIALPSPRLIYL